MSKLDELIKEHCPDGVEYKELGALGNIENIGVDKKIISGQQKVRLLNYMDIYRNQLISTNILNMEVTASENKIKNCNILKGDIFITPTSETLDDIGHSAVAIENIQNAVYSYHIMRYRLNEENIITSCFINYLFRSEFIQSKILKLAKGITRFGVSKKDFERIKIPVPPIQVQEQIVKILDDFTFLTVELEAELEAELESRKKQYQYYRDNLLIFNENVSIIQLGEIANITVGSKPQKIYEDKHKYEYINAGTTNSGYFDNYNTAGDTVTTPSRGQGGIGFVGYQKENFWLGPLCYKIQSNEKELLLNKYLYYYLQSHNNLIFKIKNEGGVPAINKVDLIKLPIAVPPLVEQQRIIDILDRFDSLCNDINNGLPAEIEKRKQQYEYYRNKLLNFDEVSNNV